ncbi:gamma-glutamyltransferase [Singulisphaera acidiphila]|uniref:Glutathione hydrolase proenzyme n=1 Tax=Singulisphaera acidiphila (strain ATCC BAA-1392 / DSM 18658 / VKM B-2454 / MOB10) TaxID=886293 RepID=L0DDJ7_SINAD|nr:gamma-glutamyltransferase [Singulisphaera acidiphila]AGA26888.1 gamma-glutamyltranspeptidase [Singulisphaera acidiphila DSM 18658]
MPQQASRPGLRRILASTILCLSSGASLVQAHDRPSGPVQKTRSAVVARHGMAATSQPLATAAAIRVLQEGGNAIDAAIAANAVLGVVEPMSCGLGGDLFAIVWDAKTKTLYGLNASGRAPYAATLDFYASKGLREIPAQGPLSWSVPGCVDGWDQLRRRFGSKDWPALLAPAIHYAEDGFPVSEIIADDWQSSARSLAKVPTTAATFLPGGKAPENGDIFRNPNLAASLRAIASDGRDAFYRGPIADAILAYSNQVDGLFARKDFDDHTSTWIQPVSTNYRGYEVWELPPNGQGIAALQMLNLLEPYDLKSLGANSAESLHLMIEAKKLAYEDRAKFYADPEFSKVPVAALISKEYAATRAPLIHRDRANDRPIPGEPAGADTIYMTVVDKDFNAVSLIQSNFNGFGSQHVPGTLGFPLQNRGCLFALDPNHANRLAPHKRPFHTIIPGFVTKQGQPWLSFGVMGGDMQAQGHAQVLSNMIDHGMDVQDAGDAARFRHAGSSDPTGTPAKEGGTVALESEIGPEVRRALEAKGHKIVDSRGGFGGYQAIRIDVTRGVLIGGSDPRKDGCASGY